MTGGPPMVMSPWPPRGSLGLEHIPITVSFSSEFTSWNLEKKSCAPPFCRILLSYEEPSVVSPDPTPLTSDWSARGYGILSAGHLVFLIPASASALSVNALVWFAGMSLSPHERLDVELLVREEPLEGVAICGSSSDLQQPLLEEANPVERRDAPEVAVRQRELVGLDVRASRRRARRRALRDLRLFAPVVGLLEVLDLLETKRALHAVDGGASAKHVERVDHDELRLGVEAAHVGAVALVLVRVPVPQNLPEPVLVVREVGVLHHAAPPHDGLRLRARVPLNVLVLRRAHPGAVVLHAKHHERGVALPQNVPALSERADLALGHAKTVQAREDGRHFAPVAAERGARRESGLALARAEVLPVDVLLEREDVHLVVVRLVQDVDARLHLLVREATLPHRARLRHGVRGGVRHLFLGDGGQRHACVCVNAHRRADAQRPAERASAGTHEVKVCKKPSLSSV